MGFRTQKKKNLQLAGGTPLLLNSSSYDTKRNMLDIQLLLLCASIVRTAYRLETVGQS